MKKNYQNIIKKGFGMVKTCKKSDERGSLCFSEFCDLPFTPKRIFWIFDVQDGKSRGCHAHSECEEVVFAVSGAFDMFVDNGKETETVHISNPSEGIYIGKNVWCELRNFMPGTVCVVVASTEFNIDGYIHDYEKFKQMCKE